MFKVNGSARFIWNTRGRHETWGHTSHPFLPRRVVLGHHLLVIRVALDRQQGGPGDGAAHLALEVEELAVGDHAPGEQCHDSLAGVVHGYEQGAELVEVGDARRHRASAVSVVGRRRARCEPHGTGGHGLGHHGLHAGQLFGGGGPFVGLLAHDVHPHRGVAHVTPVVQRRAPALHGVEILREGLELVPRHADREGVEAHVLHVLQRSGEQRDQVRSDGGDGESAVAGDDAGHAVEGRRGEPRVPEHLGVVVGVDVDEPGGDDLARGVELTLPAEALSRRRRCVLRTPPRRRPERAAPLPSISEPPRITMSPSTVASFGCPPGRHEATVATCIVADLARRCPGGAGAAPCPQVTARGPTGRVGGDCVVLVCSLNRPRRTVSSSRGRPEGCAPRVLRS